jgi:hypothetical protein
MADYRSFARAHSPLAVHHPQVFEPQWLRSRLGVCRGGRALSAESAASAPPSPVGYFHLLFLAFGSVASPLHTAPAGCAVWSGKAEIVSWTFTIIFFRQRISLIPFQQIPISRMRVQVDGR